MQTIETRYQRVAREQAERQAARLKRMKARRRKQSYGPSYMNDTGPGFHRDVDGRDRDDLGASPDF